MLTGYNPSIMFGSDASPFDAYNSGALQSQAPSRSFNMQNLSNLVQMPIFWEVAFIIAIVLLIGSHKISIEGMIGAGAS